MASAAESPKKDATPADEVFDKVGMDSAMNAMLFAEDLVDYILRKLGYNWNRESGVQKFPPTAIDKRFTPEIGEAVFDIIICHIHLIANGYREMKKRKIDTVENYRRELCISSTFYLHQGYNPERYVLLAAHFSGLAAFFFESGNTKIADASAQVLAYLLNFFIYQCIFNVNTDWFQLCLVSQMIRREVKESGTLDRLLPEHSKTKN